MDLLFPLLIVALLVPLFLNVRKQKRALSATQTLQSSLKVGDEVVTTSGLYARVALVEDDTIDLEIADGIITTWSRAVVREVLPTDDDDDTSADAPALESIDDPSISDKSIGNERPSLTKEQSTPAEESVEETVRRLDKE